MPIRFRMAAGATFVFAAALAVGPATGAAAQSVADFYKNKKVDVLIGVGVGGEYDQQARLTARWIGKHIPGNPTLVPQNMTGAGGLRAADHLYNSAPKDGTQIGTVASSTLMEALFGNPQAHFDPAQFSWLGSANQTVSFCGINPASGVDSFDQWLKSGKQLRFAASGVGAISYQHPVVMKNVLGAHIQMISGYNGAADFILALERGEVDGFCSMDVSSIESQYKPLLDKGEMKLIVQMGPHRDESFGKIPSVFDYAKTDEQRQIFSIAFDQLALGRPFMGPPGIPRDRYEALSKAFEDTLRDPALLADAAKAKIGIDYLSGDQAKAMLDRFAHYPADVLKKAKAAIGE